ncbi:MAG: hypothetical protein HW391_488 [Chloroflexi bacterium]|nr:hypothetical protein [Chloroflexota bacterium]
MPTGLQSFNNPAEITLLHPFQGTEIALSIIVFILWVAWHVVTARAENEQWDELDNRYAGESPAA